VHLGGFAHDDRVKLIQQFVNLSACVVHAGTIAEISCHEADRIFHPHSVQAS
jgi:hypothetical protein